MFTDTLLIFRIYWSKGGGHMGRCCGQNPGNGLIAAAAALTAVMAQGRTADELELLSALFDILADNLALLALSAPSGDDNSCCSKSADNQRAPGKSS